MGNIVGEGFNPIIIKQIERRQKIYGSINRNNEELTYLNTKTGWCKLVSSVNVDDASVRGLGLGGKAGKNELASRFVLFNGITNESPTKGAEETYQRAGIYNSSTPPEEFSAATPNNNFAYGIGGTAFGLNPMPGIISATIKTETRGSIKTATVVIKANNRQQFDIIDILYMRLGYSVLLEWGASSYYDNDGNYISDNTYSLADKFLLGSSDVQYENILETINQRRLKSCGNYDALFGKVVNFSWNFTKEGTYDITLKIISAGDIIESLKGNLLLPGNESYTSMFTGFVSGGSPPPMYTSGELLNLINSYNVSRTGSTSSEDTIKAFATSHEIGKLFNQYMNKLSSEPETVGMSIIKETSTTYSGVASGDSVSFFKQTYDDGGGSQYYVKLGWFLKFLEKKIIPYVNDPDVSILKIDNKVKDNLVYLLDRQLSSDPRICIFNRRFEYSDGTFTDFAPLADKFYADDIGNNKYGYIMNAYFNLVYILTQLEALKDKDGKVSIFKIIKCLCDGWNKATGGFSKLEVNIDAETNTIRLIDQNQLPDRDNVIKNLKLDIPTETAFFNVYGYDKINTNAGFIKDLSFITTVPPNLATLITVGATSNGYVVGQDATALSRMNAGLTDRFKEKIKLGPDSGTPPSTASLNEDYSAAVGAFNTFLKDLGSFQGTTLPKWNVAAITAFNTAAMQFYEYDQARQTIEAAGTSSVEAQQLALSTKSSPLSAGKSSPTCGFLPFDLSLTMDGLSGMKVYQKYSIDSDFLPTNYPTSLEFIIKTITNTIQNNQWTTTLESIAIPKNPLGSKYPKTSIVSSGETGVLVATGPSITFNLPSVNTSKAASLYKAVSDQANYIFTTRKETLDWCANYTYNIAFKIKEHIDTASTTAITYEGNNGAANQGSGGNPDSDIWRKSVMKLGIYEQIYVGDYTSSSIKKWLASQTFNYGDILDYYAPGHKGETGYMHAQIYTGNIFTTGMNKDKELNSEPNSGWSSSTKTNYGASFVFSRDWVYKLYVFRIKTTL